MSSTAAVPNASATASRPRPALTRPAITSTETFDRHDLAGINQSLAERGFAVARDVVPNWLVEELKADVWRAADVDSLPEKGAKTVMNFMEVSTSAAIKLLDLDAWRGLFADVYGTDELSLHRSACIARKPGNYPMGWHTDHSFAKDHEVAGANDVLNRTGAKAGFWLYLTGCRPSHGGLCLIEGSHRHDWEPPAGYTFPPGNRRAIVRADGKPINPNDEVPGTVRVQCNGGDVIIFENLTYHAPLVNNEDIVRLSCGLGLRPKSMKINAPWPLPESSLRFIDRLPAHLKKYAEGYTGIDPLWKPSADAPLQAYNA